VELYGTIIPTHDDVAQSIGGVERRKIARPDSLTPGDRYQELFVAVQMNSIFPDSKTFVDCVPRRDPEKILADYRTNCVRADFDLHQFVLENFTAEEVPPGCFTSNPDKTLAEHIDSLWGVLTRHPREHPPRCSLLPLPHDYVVPGGRFSELYYWDSYFTMLGFHDGKRPQLLRAMADNFAYLIDTYGHVPNGNRSYYLSRSQPPVFCLMVELFEQEGIKKAVEYLPQLHKEYAFWMDGAEELRPGEAHRRCVRMPKGELLNRYWDDRETPREESYREDVLTARLSERPVHDVYRELRAGAESGWDFSSRWQSDPTDLSTIRTTAILPVDLNSLLYKLERQIARLYDSKGEQIVAGEFHRRADKRRAAMDKYFWNQSAGAYFDYDWKLAQPRNNLTAATLAPLFVRSASPAQAKRVADTARRRLLAPGGISTTEMGNSGQQWDRPNGWAPLQWMAIRGLMNYGHFELSAEIRQRWLAIVAALYETENKLVEKYVLRPTTEHAKGGEYPLQDGFGWTNGVTAKLLREDPRHTANRRAGSSRAENSRAGN
jgi:alpha,alpha-trehalase